MGGSREEKKHRLFLVLGCFFIANALIAEFIGVKVFSFERSLGAEPVSWIILGFELSFNLTAGVLLWPVVFIMTDLINEYYGKKGVKLLSYLAAGVISYAFLVVFLAIGVHPADFWAVQETSSGPVNMQLAFERIFGQGLMIIVGSLVAFLVGQFIDVYIFQQIKKRTGDKALWLRANGSTFVSQMIDSFVVLFIAFYLPGYWSLKQVLAIGIVNMVFKVIAAVALTPVLYLVHHRIDAYLGKELAGEMMQQAQEKQ